MKNFVRIDSELNNFNSVVNIPGDKSISIRWILLASQALGPSRAYNLLESDDVKNTIKSIKKIGVQIKKKKNFYEIEGVGLNGFNVKNKQKIYAGNSGTFARLFCGLIVKTENQIQVLGDKSLSKRDFSRIIVPLSLFGVYFKSKKGKLPLNIIGTKHLKPIYFKETKGSAQVKSAIMLASLNTPGTTTIKCVPSRDHTEQMFKHCLKIPIFIKKGKKFDLIKVEGLNNYKGFNYKIPGDISSAGFMIVLTILSKNSKLLIKNININKTRSGLLEILKKMNANIKILNKRLYKGESIADIQVKSTSNLKPINCPSHLNTKAIDEFLIIFLACAKASGVSRFKNLEELRNKESDRLKQSADFLKMIGVKVNQKSGSLEIFGNPNLKLNKSFHVKNFLKDHRVFMMACVAALTFGGNFKINDKDSIKTSFPNFIEILKKLGAKIK